MQTIFKNKINLFLITFILWTTAAFADDDPGGLGADPGAPVPIDHWIPVMIIMGIAIVFFYLNKKKAIANY